MNFQTLKWMIESIIKSYKCPGCNSSVTDANIDIMWAAWSTINIDIQCISCWKHSMVKTEVLSVELNKNWLTAENIEKLKKTILDKNSKMIWSKTIIQDAEIIGLNNDLKKNKLNVADLLWDNN